MGLICKPVIFPQPSLPLQRLWSCLRFSALKRKGQLGDNDLSGPLRVVPWVHQRPLEDDCVLSPLARTPTYTQPLPSFFAMVTDFLGLSTVFNHTSLEVSTCPSPPSHPKWRKSITPLPSSRQPSRTASASRRASRWR